MQAIATLPFPTPKKGMQSVLGALNYYGRFIQDFAVYGAELYQLKDGDFDGGELSAAKASFAMLQTKVAEAPIHRHFDRSREVHIMIFANAWALSATLLQEHESTLQPVLFRGRVLKDAEMNYHPAEKRGPRLAAADEGVLHDARWQAYQSIHEVFYPGVADQVEDTVRVSCPVRCHAIAMASGDREGARKGRQVCSASTVDGDKLCRPRRLASPDGTAVSRLSDGSNRP
ncbi:hypothetical protein PC123_g20022 [Phytophthora cactorum]|nr:hypothetical protein PC120_g18201 [Phytophthora cactorum]KAG4044541.1 hypothetical protein PC123_g20022 [Phytophthora cactorum]